MSGIRYRFHCTNGEDAVFDQAGRLVWNEAELLRCARRVAYGLMRGASAALDWSDWIVDVHDGTGQRTMTLAFEDLRGAR